MLCASPALSQARSESVAQDSVRALLTQALLEVRGAQELFIGRQRVYARSIGQLGLDPSMSPDIVLSFPRVSATGYLAVARHRTVAGWSCEMRVGEMADADRRQRAERAEPVCSQQPPGSP